MLMKTEYFEKDMKFFGITCSDFESLMKNGKSSEICDGMSTVYCYYKTENRVKEELEGLHLVISKET